MEKCQHIDFDTQRAECEKVATELEKVKRNTEKVFDESVEELKEPFHSKVTTL